VSTQPNKGTTHANPWDLDFLWTLTATSAIIILLKITSYFPDVYFSFSELLFESERINPVSPLALLLRFGIPFLVGFAIVFKRGISEHEATAAGFLASFLLVWPAILIPEKTLARELYSRRYLLYLVYILFVISMTYMSRSGALIAIKLRASRKVEQIISHEILNWEGTIKPLIIGIISSLITALILANLGR